MLLKCNQQIVSVTWEPHSFLVASCNFGNLRVVSYNSTSVYVASCKLIIMMWVGSCISLHYIKYALSVYSISSMHVKQSKSNNVIWYVPMMIYTWEWLLDLLLFKWKWNGKIWQVSMQIQTNYRNSCSQATKWLLYRFLKIPRKAAAVEFSYSPCNFTKLGPQHVCFREKFPKFSEQIFLCNLIDFCF